MKPRAATFLVCVVMLAGGCARVPSDGGFAEIQHDVARRTGVNIQWNQNGQADRAIAQAIRVMLGHELSADDAVQIALLNNLNLQATYEELGIAQAELVEAGLLHNPTLSAEVRFPSHTRLPFEFDVSQSFIDLLLMPLRKRAAGAAFDAARFRVTHQVLATAADVRAAYYRALGAAQLVELRQTIARATDASFEAATRLRQAGNITELALANERAQHEQAKIDLAKAERESLDSREALTALMGLWGAEIGYYLPARLPDLPADEAAGPGLESRAIAQRADLQAARREVEFAAQTLGINRSTAWFSDLSVGGHFEQDADGTTTAGPNVQIPLPIFNQGQAAIAAAQSRLRQSERRYAALAVDIRGQVRRGRNSMLSAREQAAYYSRVIVPLRHQIVEQTQLQYNAMLVGVFQLLQARQQEIDAGREYVESLAAYWVARCELERAIGGRLVTAAAATRPAPATSPLQPASVPSSQHHHHQEAP